MIQIRESVFETNSSSMHSLVIKDDALFELDECQHMSSEEIIEEFGRTINKNGVYKSWEKDWYFGRHPFKVIDTFEEKMQYAFASGYTYEEIFPIVKRYVPHLTKIIVPEFLGTDESNLKGWLSDISLEEFLTNKKYVIICDGDEYCIWEDMKSIGLIDTNNIKER